MKKTEAKAAYQDLGIIGNFVKCMRDYINFNGRASRYEYWSFMLVYFFILFGAGFISGFFGVNWIAEIIWLAFLPPSFTVLNRRLHDQDRSLWNVVFKPLLWSLIPLGLFSLTLAASYAYGIYSFWLSLFQRVLFFVFCGFLLYIFVLVLYHTTRCGKDQDNVYGPKIPFDEKINEKGRLVMIVYFLLYLLIFGVNFWLLKM